MFQPLAFPTGGLGSRSVAVTVQATDAVGGRIARGERTCVLSVVKAVVIAVNPTSRVVREVVREVGITVAVIVDTTEETDVDVPASPGQASGCSPVALSP